MYAPQTLLIQKKNRTPDGIGGFKFDFEDFTTVKGYIDLASGTDQAVNQNAFIKESTHYAIIPQYVSGITENKEIPIQSLMLMIQWVFTIILKFI